MIHENDPWLKTNAKVASPEPHQEQPPVKKYGGLPTMWCPKFLKGKCPKTDEDCPLPHVSAEVKAQIQAKIQKGIDAGAHKA